MRIAALTILFLLMIIGGQAKTYHCNQFINLDENSDNLILVKNQVCYLDKNGTVAPFTKAGHASFMFKDSVVFYLNVIVPQKRQKVYVEVGNPNLSEVTLFINGENVKASKYQKRVGQSEHIKLANHRNFRFELDLLQDTTEIKVRAISNKFWQPMPIIILTEKEVRKFSAIEGFMLGSMVGVFAVLTLIFLVLTFTIKNNEIIYFSIFGIFCMLCILYELNSLYTIWYGMSQKLDIIIFLLIFNGQIIAVELFINSYFKNGIVAQLEKKVEKYIFLSISFRVTFIMVSIVLIGLLSLEQVKYIQYAHYWSASLTAIAFVYIRPGNFQQISTLKIIFLSGFALCSFVAYYYLIQCLGIAPYGYGVLYGYQLKLMPVNTTLPEIYAFTFIILIVVATIIIYKEYAALNENRSLIESETKSDLMTYSIKLVDVIEKERIHISQTLHDNIGVALSLIKFRIYQILENFDLSPKERNEIKEQAELLIKENRATSHQINPGSLKYVTLTEFFEAYFIELSFDNEQLEIVAEGLDVLSEIEPEKRGRVYRMITATLPSKKHLLHYKGIEIAFFKEDEVIGFVTCHHLKSNNFPYKLVYKKKIESLLPVLEEVYEGKYELNDFTKDEFEIKIVIPEKYFISESSKNVF
ncbi:MAG: hypothetical protein R2728_07130 [Chitinophagales bacterium]